MNSLISYLKNVRGELAHVVWPNRRQSTIHTILIILISAAVALLLTGFDYVFTGVIDRLILGL
ncbi:MAG TPA: preprotein translocase subunit SecE [Candidatus Paceibacterota bacterium]|nr:preprotein translocase subunit SecE [Candidatus Paceibacterota bacterium]